MPSPAPTAAPMTVEDIEETFALFDDWEDKYRFVIDLGKDLGVLEDRYRDEDHLVRGCQSQVWLHTHYEEPTQKLSLALDSDAHIVRGLISIVLAAYQDRTPQDILDYDIEGLFDRLDLLRHLSPTRGNGLRAMIKRVREAAQLHADG